MPPIGKLGLSPDVDAAVADGGRRVAVLVERRRQRLARHRLEEPAQPPFGEKLQAAVGLDQDHFGSRLPAA